MHLPPAATNLLILAASACVYECFNEVLKAVSKNKNKNDELLFNSRILWIFNGEFIKSLNLLIKYLWENFFVKTNY